jgi:hypothetical protein
MRNLNSHPITPAVAFPTRPDWPVYEAPSRWYISQGKPFGSR